MLHTRECCRSCDDEQIDEVFYRLKSSSGIEILIRSFRQVLNERYKEYQINSTTTNHIISRTNIFDLVVEAFSKNIITKEGRLFVYRGRNVGEN